ncbi:chain length determinant protein EpsF [Jeongeupia naejangsanensis]|uniref:Chain length determinant protein EpsF n=1 Tax=Jeongeupia naejangsanensis TaxID=613195 RepID=A0ABS2BHQ0_9NEIS|nr:chain length determinant protein EpsF [Jeongeupia naejangsanensis]MBM3115147.1 chain length determinant protein EpsF [Jeongeupia naejangsanensis]
MKFEQFWNILRARKWIALAVLSLVVLSALAVSLLLPKQYSAASVVAVDIKANDPVTGQPVVGYLAPSFMATQVDIIASQNTALKVVDALGFANLPEARSRFLAETGGHGDIRHWFAETLLKHLDVKPSRDSNVINVGYTATEPRFAATLANAFVQAYVRTTVEIKTAAAQQNNQFFQSQLKGLQANVAQTQQRLSDYQQQQGIVATDERLDIETQRLNEIASQLVGVQSLTYDAQSRARGGAAAPDVLNNPLIQQLKNQLAQQEAKLKEQAEKNGPNHPHYLQARAEVEATRAQLNQLLAQYASGLSGAAGNSAARQGALQQALAAQKARVLELKSQRSGLEILKRDVENAQRAYDQALQRTSQTMLESRSDQANIIVLRSATEPDRPSGPRVLLNVALAIVLGLLLAVVTALGVELADRRIRARADIEDALGIDILATIPTLKLQ